MKDISVGILAGGRSSRMGMDKALIEYRGNTFLGRLVKEFSGWKEITVSLADRGGITPPEGCRTVCDVHRDIGPMEGIRQVLKASSSEYVFVCAVDMPFLTADLAEYMTRFISSDYDCYVIRDSKHFQPLCAIYSKAALPLIDELISKGRYRLMDLLEGLRTKYISLEHTDFSEKQVSNVNTRQELSEMSLPAVFAVSGTKDSGKTWLIARLINEFISDGYSVGVIKHDAHGYDMDEEGRDTDIFSKAGTAFTAIYCPERFNVSAAASVDHNELLKYCPGADIVICEGLKDSDLPKFVVARQQTYECYDFASPVMGGAADTDSVRSDLSRHFSHVFDLDDISNIYSHIKEYMGIL